jgi:hypothetical protein
MRSFLSFLLGAFLVGYILLLKLERQNRKAAAVLEAERADHKDTAQQLYILRSSYAAGLEIDSETLNAIK